MAETGVLRWDWDADADGKIDYWDEHTEGSVYYYGMGKGRIPRGPDDEGCLMKFGRWLASGLVLAVALGVMLKGLLELLARR